VNWQEKAETMLGYHWIVTLAHIAGYEKRTVQRWRTGYKQIPDDVVQAINDMYEIYKELNK